MSEVSYYLSENKFRPDPPRFRRLPAARPRRPPARPGNPAGSGDRRGGHDLPAGRRPRSVHALLEPARGDRQGVPGASWFLTGDYARFDDDGYIWFLGRKDDIINSFGYRVSPHEIERVLKTHPAVADCAATGEELAADKVLVVAYVMLHPGAVVDADDCRSALRPRAPGRLQGAEDRLPDGGFPAHQERQDHAQAVAPEIAVARSA